MGAQEARSASEKIPYWGYDQAPENRPGVPMEKDPPAPFAGAHWSYPETQTPPGFRVLHRAGLDDLTPAYGTGQPLHGLSGILRRLGYRIPEHRPAHWATLMLADRVDIVESAVSDSLGGDGRAGTVLLGLAGAGLGLVVGLRLWRANMIGAQLAAAPPS
jgi:hypothetical protein